MFTLYVSHPSLTTEAVVRAMSDLRLAGQITPNVSVDTRGRMEPGFMLDVNGSPFEDTPANHAFDLFTVLQLRHDLTCAWVDMVGYVGCILDMPTPGQPVRQGFAFPGKGPHPLAVKNEQEAAKLARVAEGFEGAYTNPEREARNVLRGLPIGTGGPNHRKVAAVDTDSVFPHDPNAPGADTERARRTLPSEVSK